MPVSSSRRFGTPARRLLLFVVSMAVPCLVLVVLGIRIIEQQEELAEKHAADERRLLLAEFERELLTRLERARSDPADPSRAFIATTSDGRLVLPWGARNRRRRCAACMPWRMSCRDSR